VFVLWSAVLLNRETRELARNIGAFLLTDAIDFFGASFPVQAALKKQ